MKEISQGDIIYSMIILVNNTVVHIWMLLRKYTLKVLITGKKNSVTKYGDVCLFSRCIVMIISQYI